MDVATKRSEVGIRELKNGLSKYIDRVRAGEEVIVTDRGRPVARLSSVDATEDRLGDLVASGLVRAPSSRGRHVPERRIKAKAPVSDLVAEQRRWPHQGMITYVDTSTLLKLVIDEDGSERAGTIWASADTVASVSLIAVEARAALAAAKRGRRLTTEQHADARAELDTVLADLHIVEVTEELIAEAAELAEAEALRGYDAVHLAAALLVGATILTSADTDLCAAGDRRGLHVANPVAAAWPFSPYVSRDIERRVRMELGRPDPPARSRLDRGFQPITASRLHQGKLTPWIP